MISQAKLLPPASIPLPPKAAEFPPINREDLKRARARVAFHVA